MEHQMWNLFDVLQQDLSTERSEYKEYREANVNVKDITKYEIFTKDLDARIRPHMGYIDVRGQILKSDGSKIGASENVALINNGYNVFKKAELHIANKAVETIENVGITTTVRNLVNFSDDYSRSAATDMLWFPDTSDHPNRNRLSYEGNATKLESNADIKSLVSSIKGNKNFNNGFLERWKLTRGSKQLNLWLPLSKLFGFCEDIDKVLTGVQFKVVLWKNQDEDILYTDSNDTYKFQINHVSLWLPHVDPSLTTLAKYESYLASGQSLELMWEAANCYVSDRRNDAGGSWRILSNQHNVSNIFIVFQTADKSNSQKHNNMIFNHMNLERSQVRINGKQYPEEELECSFSADDLNYSRAYTSFLSAGLKDWGCEVGTAVSFNHFAEIYPVFHYDVSKREEVKSAQPVDVEFRWKLRNSSEYYIYCIVVSEIKAQLSLQDRKTFVIP